MEEDLNVTQWGTGCFSSASLAKVRLEFQC